MEVLDIVDENDEIVKQLTVKDAYETYNIKRVIAVLVFRDETHQELLLQQRADVPVKPWHWSIVTGLVSAGKSYDDIAKAELQEEMFHAMTPPELPLERLFKFRKDADNDPGFVTVYRTVYDGEFSLEPEEVADWKWMKLSDVQKELQQNEAQYTGTMNVVLQEYVKRYSG